ncbi:hypothetical protein PQX77_014370 [Marasmius sp. AFHP31]|nr:hypothetical protein PQX77_014370 [Marasmius sp. AFHP31]
MAKLPPHPALQHHVAQYLIAGLVSISASVCKGKDASSALSHHLGLEIYESVRDSFKAIYEQESFVAQEQKSALVMTVDEADAEVVLPLSLQPSFKLSIPDSESVESLNSVLSTYLHRASNGYSSIYESLSSKWDATEIRSMFSSIRATGEPVFAALELSSLSRLRAEYGLESDEYKVAVAETAGLLKSVLEDGRVQLAVLTHGSRSAFSKRQEDALQSQAPVRVPPQHPIDSISTCFTTADICNNATSSCSGRGQCVEASKIGKTCFVCACKATTTGKGNAVKTEHWVGESCERKDVSGPFVLFVGTAIVMIVLAIGSVSFLYNVGQESLPPTLTGTAVHARRD